MRRRRGRGRGRRGRWRRCRGPPRPGVGAPPAGYRRGRAPARAGRPAGRGAPAPPLVQVARLDEAPPRPLPPADSPLGRVRVLDLTRVIAGPVAGRVLASYRADVLPAGADHLALVLPAAIDTGFVKRFTHLDLRTDTGRAALTALVREA